jgi:hypothetical protein
VDRSRVVAVNHLIKSMSSTIELPAHEHSIFFKAPTRQEAKGHQTSLEAIAPMESNVAFLGGDDFGMRTTHNPVHSFISPMNLITAAGSAGVPPLRNFTPSDRTGMHLVGATYVASMGVGAFSLGFEPLAGSLVGGIAGSILVGVGWLAKRAIAGHW